VACLATQVHRCNKLYKLGSLGTGKAFFRKLFFPVASTYLLLFWSLPVLTPSLIIDLSILSAPLLVEGMFLLSPLPSVGRPFTGKSSPVGFMGVD
jgi:hypothetical protein